MQGLYTAKATIRIVGLIGALFFSAAAAPAQSADVTVMSSGGYTQALKDVAADFEASTGTHLNIVLGPSMGTAPEAIPHRLERGEKADLVVMVGYALGGLINRGLVAADSRVDLVNSNIALAVRAGAPKPDIATVEALTKTLLTAKSIAYSDSASGVYIETEMYRKLGIEAALKPKSKMIVALRVGDIVAAGDAEIGFQQVSELLPIKGITIVGELPAAVQKTTVYSAGIPSNAANPAGAKALLAYMRSPAVLPIVARTGLVPITP
jgi:molybdate transport system substrate-binding protein